MQIRTFFSKQLDLSVFVTLVALVATTGAYAQSSEASVDALVKKASIQGSAEADISIVRRAALQELAQVMGARQGLQDKSCAISKEITGKAQALDRNFRFNALVMGAGVLPPVISQAVDTVSLEATVMRIASRTYKIDEPARVVDIAPTWRDWLNVGMGACDKASSDAFDLPVNSRPRDAAETAYFRSEVERSYVAAQAQAQGIFEANLARLERAYFGMRLYFDLYARGMVTAPQIISATDIVNRDDPNVLIVGDTLIRITVPVDFVDNYEKWKPLAP
jgi:defect-in-organelle-trafficking protein DotC